jgi:intracellular multiplication protein IcmP
VLAVLLTANVDGLKPAEELSLRLAKTFKRLDAKGNHNPVIDNTDVDGICTKYLDHSAVKEVRKQHAYTTTLFMGLLENAWNKGIFTSPNVLWLKPVDRTLYLSLCALGGDRPFAEALGPWSHFMVEQRKKIAVTHPCIEGGTDALKAMLYEEEWIGSDEGMASDVAAIKALEGGNDDEYSPTRGIDLFDPPKPKSS